MSFTPGIMKKAYESHDRELVKDLKRGKKTAYCEIYNLFSSRIYRLSKKFYLKHEDAEEVVQEVFLILWERKEMLDPDKDFAAYLLKIAKSIIIKVFKRRVLSAAYESYVTRFSDHYNTDTENIIHYNNFREIFEREINDLPTVRKEIMMLSREQYLSNDEIAQHLGLSRRTVENHIYRALKTIKKKLDIVVN